MNAITVEYKGQQITYYEYNNKWGCQIIKDKDSLADAKKAIDAFLKSESVFSNMPCLISVDFRDRDCFAEATITSIADDGEFWVKDSRGVRSKRRKVYAVSASNLEINGKLKELFCQRAAITKQIEQLESEMQPITRDKTE